MRYSLWSHGRLVGHTDLDIHTVSSTMRQGFVEPTAEGKSLLIDATGVWRAMAEVKRGIRARGLRIASDDMLFLTAVQRREALNLELRDESGTRFPCEFIRIYDLVDDANGIVDEMCDTAEEEEAAFQIRLSALTGEAREQALAHRAESEAKIEAAVTEVLETREEERMFSSGWPPPPPEDPRWETMQYHLQAFLASDF